MQKCNHSAVFRWLSFFKLIRNRRLNFGWWWGRTLFLWQRNESKCPLLVVVAFSHFSELLIVKRLLEAHFYPIDLSDFWFCFESLSKSHWLISYLQTLWTALGLPVGTFGYCWHIPGHFLIDIDLSSISNHTERKISLPWLDDHKV